MIEPAFLVGYDEAWFGGNYGSGLTTNFDVAYVDKTFDGIVRAGGHVVRLFLFELMQGWVLGTGTPRIQGLDPKLLANLDQVLELARSRGLWVYLTGLESGSMPADAGPQRDLYWNLVNDDYGEATAYETLILAPLLATLDAHRDVVYAFDIMNEIQAARQRSYWPEPVLAPRAFLQRERSFIKSKSPWLRVSASSGYDTAAIDIATGWFSGLGLDFYDLHEYSDTGSYLGMNEVCTRAAQDGVPVVLGEFGQKSHTTDDALQKNATQKFLADAKASCFKAALAWRYDAAESWWDYLRSDGTFRPAVTIVQQY